MKYFGLAAAVATVISINQNCGNQANQNPYNPYGPTANTLAISPSSVSVALNGYYQFTATGGSGSYYFYVSSGYGYISASGYYTAPNFPTNSTVSVRDNSTGSIASATVNVGSGGSLTINPTSVNVSLGGNYQFAATGGSGNYTYSISPAGNGTITASGYFTAPGTAMVLTVTVTDSSNATASASVNVTNSTATNICDTAFGCGSIVGLSQELDARTANIAQTNAQAACWVLRGSGSVMQNYQTFTHNISCGYAYGLGNWVSGTFVHQEVPICSTGTVTVLSNINCSN